MGDSPTDLTYADYRESIETSAEVITEQMEDDPATDVHQMVWETADSSRWVMMNTQALMAVLLSDTNPDNPDYAEPWTTYYDGGESWTDAVGCMAYVCVYSDIVDYLKRNTDVEI